MAQNDLSQVLTRELVSRKSRNPAYSLRAFAKTLSISPAQLSQLISGKRKLTEAVAIRIGSQLGLSFAERETLLTHKRKGSRTSLPDYTVLDEDRLQLMSDWVYFAILSLGDLKKNRAEPKWIARRLGITEVAAIDAFNRLKRMGLIAIEKGQFKQTGAPITTSTSKANIPARTLHKSYLHIAEERLESVDPTERDFSTINFAADPTRLPWAKEMIREFRRRLCAGLEQGEKTEVYALSIQLFPLTKGKSK